MTSDAEGVVVVQDKVLVIKSIHVRYHLAGCPEDKREAAERSHTFHARTTDDVIHIARISW